MSNKSIDFDSRKMADMFASFRFYDSEDIFLRELIQNAYDACYTRQALEQSWGAEFLAAQQEDTIRKVREPYVPSIRIEFNSEMQVLVVEDNGIGINEQDLINYIEKIGNCYYVSEEFAAQKLSYVPISQFGIGLLSCFLIAHTIHIESRKDKCANTAWNVSNQVSLVPIAAKWYGYSMEIEHFNPRQTMMGTRIGLTLKPEYAKKLSMNYLTHLVNHFMAYQPIPIVINVDGKRRVIGRPGMEKADWINSVAGINTIEVDDDMVEGYLVLYNTQHRHMIGTSILFQQNFRISPEGVEIPLKPEWLKFMGYYLNVKERYLNLELTRDNVVRDKKFRILRAKIGAIIVEHYKENIVGLSQFLKDGRENIMSEFEREMNLLAKAYFVHVFLKNKEVQLPLETVISGYFGREIKIAVITKKMFVYYRKHHIAAFVRFVKEYQLILFEPNLHSFLQFIKPYIKSREAIVTKTPGVVYVAISADLRKPLARPKPQYDYQWRVQECRNEELFCFVTNDQYGSFEININRKNKNAQLFDRCMYSPKIRMIHEVIIENIKQRIINTRNGWNRIIDFGGSFVEEWQSENLVTVQSIGCLEENFPEAVNEFISSKLSDGERKRFGLTDLLFTKEDFISWWYM